MASIAANQRFGRLVAIRPGPPTVYRSGSVKTWICVCDCGQEAVCDQGALKRGAKKSCGCLSRESHSRPRKHGHTSGGKPSPEYVVWQNMLRRCETPTNPAFPNYGGRGISVCDAWHDFETFFRAVGKRPSSLHSIDRYPDNDGDYEPGNVRWATRREQLNNTRVNVRIEFLGRVQTLQQWTTELGLNYQDTGYRIRNGMSAAEALTLPAGFTDFRRLTDADCEEIRRLWSLGVRQKEMAKRFQVSQSTISDAINRAKRAA